MLVLNNKCKFEKYFIIFVLIITFLLSMNLLFAQQKKEQSECITLQHILNLLEKKVDQKTIIKNVKKFRVDFELDWKTTAKLVRAGSDDSLLDAIDKNQCNKVLIKMTDFRSRVYIKGEVQGLKVDNYKNYKIVAYIFTDMWYQHPYAENAPGRGFGAIDNTGKWELETVWRGYQSSRLAFLLVPKTTLVPASVALDGKTPESALLGAIKCEHYSIIDAPEGI